MATIIDARGYNCPQPVIMTKKAIDEGMQNLTTVVNQKSSLENVKRFAKGQGFEVEVEEKNSDYHIHIFKGQRKPATEMPADNECVCKADGNGKLAILITDKLMGKGDSELGEVLIKAFLYSLVEISDRISHLIFVNSGVFLALRDSQVIEHLETLQKQDVNIFSCGTCLDFYGLSEQLAVGRVTNMYEIADILTSSSKTMTL